MRSGVVVFPGSNCDHDVYHVLKHLLGQDTAFLWHDEADLSGVDLVVLPGGFAYGDYLRAGAMAAQSPIMAAVKRHAEAGGRVLGICNGFQVLLEAGLLPGAMRRNAGLRFSCREVDLRVERNDLPFTAEYAQGEVVRMPIAHAEGNYAASEETLDELEREGRIVFRYAGTNPNGAAHDIAGIVDAGGNVLGMMPHPERCAEATLGNDAGRRLFAGAVGLAREAA